MTGRMIRAGGTEDVAGDRLAFRKRRFEMIADIPTLSVGELQSFAPAKMGGSAMKL